jgi:hypothetical protein
MADNERSERKEEKEQHQDMELVTWRKKIEMIGIDIKGLDRENRSAAHKDICGRYLYSWIHLEN